jgi:hypothetical protein
MSLQMMQELTSLTDKFGQKELFDKVNPVFTGYYQKFMSEMGAGQRR